MAEKGEKTESAREQIEEAARQAKAATDLTREGVGQDGLLAQGLEAQAERANEFLETRRTR